jgi:hypothetical protein
MRRAPNDEFMAARRANVGSYIPPFSDAAPILTRKGFLGEI